MYELIETKEAYVGKYIKLLNKKIKLPDGRDSHWECCEGRNGVSILAVTEEDEVLLVKQYRPAIEKYILEIPAGLVEEGEDPELAALRELEEETGYRADKIEKVFEYFTSPGFSSTRLIFFRASFLTKTKQNLDEDEFVEVVKIKRSDLKLEEIEDSKTIIALQFFNQNWQKTKNEK